MEVGIDEAGRGCIFGPIYAAAVIWDPELDHKFLKDSKKLSACNRCIAYDYILDNCIDYGIGSCTSREIDNENILIANMKAMHRALDNIIIDFDSIKVDGNVFWEYNNIPHQTIVKGDTLHKSIMAASIIAKVSHDEYIDEVLKSNNHLDVYGLTKNKGYCTAAHVSAIETFGRSEFHRYTFRLPFEKKYVTTF